MQIELTLEEFKNILPRICSAETSRIPHRWSPENPLIGHCATVALLAQHFFGGTLLRGSLVGTPFERWKWHYWNRFRPGEMEDFTVVLFERYPIVFGHIEIYSSETLLEDHDVNFRYEKLLVRCEEYVLENRSLFKTSVQ